MNSSLELLRTAVKQFSLSATSPRFSLPYLELRDEVAEAELPISAQMNSTYLVIEGELRVTHATGEDLYRAGDLFFPSAYRSVPSHVVAGASGDRYLALHFSFTAEDVTSVVLEMDLDSVLQEHAEHAQIPDDGSWLEAFTALALRIVLAETQGPTGRFLTNHYKRELIYTLVSGSAGRAFVSAYSAFQQSREIFNTNDWIRGNYKSGMAVDDLADKANMSVSSFHRKFKAAIGMGPLQCQKQLRLTEARRLMIDQGFSVTEVALEVGYESVSQFSREYRRMFGQPPQRDVHEVLRGRKIAE
ncbi:MAG TPA: hypothetical protein DEA38_16605 [Stenotrophomonas sp.]|nr:hypothetical protein [Stenotrophomonas sp.]